MLLRWKYCAWYVDVRFALNVCRISKPTAFNKPMESSVGVKSCYASGLPGWCSNICTHREPELTTDRRDDQETGFLVPLLEVRTGADG